MHHETSSPRRSRIVLGLVLFALASTIASALPAQTGAPAPDPRIVSSSSASACAPTWLPGGAWPGTSGVLYALEAFDDGSGPSLFAGGNFTSAGGVAASSIAKWNGTTWSALGSGVNDYVKSMVVFDDGAGPALFVVGNFTTAGGITVNHAARWNGSAWSSLASGLDDQANAATVFDDGSGSALYVCGYFSNAGATHAKYVAKWNGTAWSPVGMGMNGGVFALCAFDDGHGPALYAGGNFTAADGAPAAYIAKWNGVSWSPVGGGLNGYVNAFTVFDDGIAPALYAGGGFTTAGGVAANAIARWNGSNWSAVGGGMDAEVRALASFDDGSGPALYVGGFFTTAGGAVASNIAKSLGSTWSPLGGGTNGFVYALTTWINPVSGSGASHLYAGGLFSAVNGMPADHIADWGTPPGCGTPGVSICEPGVNGVLACPCGNAPSSSGLGCQNSASTGGAHLSASGIARITLDTLHFTTAGETSSATSIVLQASATSASGTVFGQGVSCLAGTLKRLYVKHASGGAIDAPAGGDPSVHAASAALGDTIAPGSHRYYGVYYRDSNVLGACPAASTFNITQQLDVAWSH